MLDGRELVFRASPTNSNHYPYDLRDSIDPIKIARVHYRKGEVGFETPRDRELAKSLSGEHEDIYIFPVLSTDRAAAHAALLTDGVQLIRAWLGEERPETWRSGRHTFELWWDTFSKRFETKTY